MSRQQQFNRLLAVVTVLAALSPMVTAVDKRPPEVSGERTAETESGKTEPILYPSGDWPLWYGVQQTGKVDASFTSWGTFGLAFNPVLEFYDQLWPRAGFQEPRKQSEYLFAGAIWIGGIVGTDTLVSVGADGWQLAHELYPPSGDNRVIRGSVAPFPYMGDHAYRGEFSDTIIPGVQYLPDVISSRAHLPLNVTIANRSHARSEPPYTNCIVYDMVITNLGSEPISQGYVGFYFDCDVGEITDFNRHQDDLTGYSPADSIAYIMDNDGNPTHLRPATGAFGLKVLHTSFTGGEASYNWWVNNGNPYLDWGPRLKSDTRDFGTGGNGTPEGDANKYYVMSNGEIDYDQVLTAWMAENDTVWQPLTIPFATALSRSWDTRFLYSVGPFDLLPDSSVRIVYSTFLGDSIHVVPHNVDNLGETTYRPFQYVSNLDFSGLRASAQAAKAISEQLLSPNSPVQGFAAKAVGPDTVLVQWDPWVLPGVDGYTVYLETIPKSAYVHEGVPPVWYRTQQPTVYEQPGHQYQLTLAGLNPYEAHSCQIAHRIGPTSCTRSEPLVVKAMNPVSVPLLVDTLLFVVGNTVTLAWQPSSGGPVRQYNIYKFDDTAFARQKYSRYYSRFRAPDPADSVLVAQQKYYYYALPVYATVQPSESVFVDADVTGDAVYCVSAVDTAGFETGFSDDIVVYQVPERATDVLVMTKSSSYLTNYVYPDSVVAYYDRILDGVSHDYYMHNDSINICPAMNASCVHWRDFMPYRMLIIDDGLRDKILSSGYEDASVGFTRYLLSGGTILYCGSFSDFSGTVLSPTSNPGWRSRTHPFIQRFFGIDSVYYVGVAYYKNATSPPYVDSLLGFTRAVPAGSWPALDFDSLKNPFTSYVTSNWPRSSAPSVSVFTLDSTADTIYTFQSLYPATSRAEGRPVGVHKQTSESNAYLLGFHLWYMDEADAGALVEQILATIPSAPGGDVVASTIPAAGLRLENWPNPFNPSTTIRFTIPSSSHVRLEVFNILGQRVRTLLDEEMVPGDREIVWDGTDASRTHVASGIYLYRLSAGGEVRARKMLLLK